MTIEKKNPNATTIAASPTVLTAINDRINREESANHGVFDFAVDATSETFTSAQFWDGHTIRLTEGSPAPGGAVTITVPGGSPSEQRGAFLVDNQMTEDCSFTVSGQSGTVPIVPAGETALLTCDGDDVSFAETFNVNSEDIDLIVKLTQAAYDALSPKIATTLYNIVG